MVIKIQLMEDRHMHLQKPMKNIMIFGDSYSTFEGYIPKGYAVYYSGADCDNTDVRRVEETWWHRLCTDLDLHLIRNDSWSGSTLCNTGYNGDCSKSNSFLYRLEKLYAENFFREQEVDTVFIFGCTNDSWANAPLGEVKLENQTAEDLFSVCPAIGYFLGRLKEILPEANIIFLINTELKTQIGEAVKAASDYHGTDYIQLEYIDKCCGHPTIQGMQDIAEQIKAFLNREA
ncbi:MAG: hypothetical protein E7631_09605 [Ruminococcaceae bacterium]|nr:hypothetical protein [Oscillospiraceae bacterium]